MRGARARSAAALVVIVLLGAAGSALAGEGADGGEPLPEPRPGLMREIVAQEEVSTERSASPMAYLRHVYTSLLDRLVVGVSDSPWLRRISQAVVWGVLLLAAAVLVWALVRVAGGLLAGRRRRAPDAPIVEREVRAPADPRAELDAALARGDGHRALHELWRWIGERLAAGAADAAFSGVTIREMLAAAGGERVPPDALQALQECARSSERWLYRGEPFGVEDVASMRERLGGWLG